jgi:hypothetical protein
MMLPSGNDAAQSLAIHFGLMLIRERYLKIIKDPDYRPEDWRRDRNHDILKVDMNNYCNLDDDNPDLIDNALEEFYKEMNIAASDL